MGQGPFYAIPGEINSHQFILHLIDGSALQPSATLAAGDFLEVTNGGVAANVDTLPVTETNGAYSWAQSAAESVAGSKVTLLCSDQTGPQTFLDTNLDVIVYTIAEVAEKFYHGGSGPGVWVNVGGDSGAVLGVNGTPSNPVDNWAHALTLAGKLNIFRFYILGGTSITLTGSADSYCFHGVGELDHNEVVLGSQDCNGSRFHNLRITGTQGSGGRASFFQCLLDDVTTLHPSAIQCGLDGVCTLTAATDNIFDACFSMVPGNGTPELTLATNCDLMIRHYSGGLQINSGGATNDVSMEADGQVIIDASCSNLSITLRGMMTVTDNGTNSNITDDAVFNVDNLAGGDSVAFTVTDSGFAPTTTQFKITASPFPDSIPVGRSVLFTSSTDLGDHMTICLNWNATTQVVTVREMPAAPADGDLGKWT